MAAFSSLPRKAQRAAFANMDKKKKATGTARKRMTAQSAPVLKPTSNGKFTPAGRISREQAALIMFGSRGAAARIAKARKKK